MTAQPDAPPQRLALGYFAVMAAVLIWAGWIVATREAVTRAYAPLDLAILRYTVPAALLAPVWLRRGLFPRGENPWLLLIMTVGWGGPFVFLVSTGLTTVKASLFGPLVPGMLPMVVAFWGLFVLGERITALRAAGLVFIAAAVGLIIVPAALNGDEGLLTGAPWLLAACAGWSAFTIAYRNTALSGLEAAAYVCLYSTPFLLAAGWVFGSDLPRLPVWDVTLQAIVQGVISGLASVVGFTYAVRTLGVARASVFTSLVPVLAALGGWGLLDETISLAGWFAIGCAFVGVYLVNRSGGAKP